MAESKPRYNCPICEKSFLHVKQHLENFHRIKNRTETRLLTRLVKGPIPPGEVQCPIQGCGKTVKGIKGHMKRMHPELSVDEQDILLGPVRRSVVLKKLSELRASNPKLPMVSQLDLQEEEERGPPSSITMELKEIKYLLRGLSLEVKGQQQKKEEAGLSEMQEAGALSAPMVSSGLGGSNSSDEEGSEEEEEEEEEESEKVERIEEEQRRRQEKLQ